MKVSFVHRLELRNRIFVQKMSLNGRFTKLHSFTAYYPEVPMLEVPQTRPGSSLGNWIKKHSPQIPNKLKDEITIKVENDYDMDTAGDNAEEDQVRLFLTVECLVFCSV